MSKTKFLSLILFVLVSSIIYAQSDKKNTNTTKTVAPTVTKKVNLPVVANNNESQLDMFSSCA